MGLSCEVVIRCDGLTGLEIDGELRMAPICETAWHGSTETGAIHAAAANGWLVLPAARVKDTEFYCPLHAADPASHRPHPEASRVQPG